MSLTFRAFAGAAALATLAAWAGPTCASAARPTRVPGTVVAAVPLPRKLWVPGTARAWRLTYVTTDANGRAARSTGELFLPKGHAPTGGWRVISWAHGTSGLGDTCAPSVMGPAEPARDFGYLSTWAKAGYAIVASDYAGLGSPGLPAYLNGRSEAHNVADMVKAGRAFAQATLPADQQLSRRWVTIGQSQGGGAAIYTARWATQYGGPGLSYLGAVGTGTPAYIEVYASLIGPHLPPIALSPGITSYFGYLFASLRSVHPELGLDRILTDTGRKYLKLAETECVFAFEDKLNGVNIGDFFTQPVATLPNWTATIDDYLKMPESGFDKPFFMGHGVLDTDVPFAATAAYVGMLKANQQPLTFKAYAADHSGALLQSEPDAHAFVEQLFAGK
jgi:hypothetical protein